MELNNQVMETLFWISISIVFYVTFGYGIIAYAIVKIKRALAKPKALLNINPLVSVIIAAFNEEDIIDEKFHNNLAQSYDSNNLEFIFVTDGSNDATFTMLENLIKCFPNKNAHLLHKNERSGKTAALNHAIPYAKGEILIFTDANTMLNADAVQNIVNQYKDPKVGAVAGEKRVKDDSEGLYWKYESFLKKIDSELYSCVGAAGELFSIRTNLYKIQPNDTILDDFMISLEVVKKGFKIAYEPNAYAVEEGSANISEELKRKVRIGAGGIQSILRSLSFLLPINIFNIQYLSRKAFRWTIMPIAIMMTLISNIFLVYNSELIWQYLLLAQVILLYVPALVYITTPEGHKPTKLAKFAFYFLFMHYAIIKGWFRFAKGTQKAAWEKSKRKEAK